MNFVAQTDPNMDPNSQPIPAPDMPAAPAPEGEPMAPEAPAAPETPAA
jgi:hypothetical protein